MDPQNHCYYFDLILLEKSCLNVYSVEFNSEASTVTQVFRRSRMLKLKKSLEFRSLTFLSLKEALKHMLRHRYLVK